MDNLELKKAYAALDLAYSQLDEIVSDLDPCDDSDAAADLQDIFEQAESARDCLEPHVPTNERGDMDLPACGFRTPLKQRKTPPKFLNHYPVVGYAPTARTMHKHAHVAIVDVTRGDQYVLAVVNWWPDLGDTWHASEYCRTIAEAVQIMGARV